MRHLTLSWARFLSNKLEFIAIKRLQWHSSFLCLCICSIFRLKLITVHHSRYFSIQFWHRYQSHTFVNNLDDGKMITFHLMCYIIKQLLHYKNILNMLDNKEAVTQTCVLWKRCFRSFEKFTGKHLCQSLLFNKVAGGAGADSGTDVFMWILWNFS